MIKIPIHDLHGASAGDFGLPDELLVLKRGRQAVQDVVVAYRAALRSGTASTLSKGLVSGSNRKPWRQKGLGRARAGYRQSPVWRGGAVAFGPHPRSYAKDIGKQVASLAYARALSERIAAGDVKIVEPLVAKEGRTKEVASMLQSLKVGGRALLVVEKPDVMLKRAARNMPNVELCCATDLNVYQILSCAVLVVSRGAMAVLVERLKKATGAQ